MKKKASFSFILVFVVLAIASCKKDYQKLSTEYIRNLPDSCEFLSQVENEVEHLVYYKGTGNETIYCYNFETESNEEIKVPKAKSITSIPIAFGAGNENILVIYSDVEENQSPTVYSNSCVHIYNLKTRSFKELLSCNGCVVDKGKKQLTCYVFETDRYGDGSRTDEVYDFDGKMISKKEVEVIDYEVVPNGTLAAKEQARIAKEQQANRLSLWECILCKERIPSKGTPSSVGCRYLLGHSWRRVSYLE